MALYNFHLDKGEAREMTKTRASGLQTFNSRSDSGFDLSILRKSMDPRPAETTRNREQDRARWGQMGGGDRDRDRERGAERERERGGEREKRSLSEGRSYVSESHNSEVAETQDRVTGWILPFRSNCPYAPAPQIASEFKRLDLTGEGRLTYLTLKSALELREVAVDDITLRRWLKEADRGSKGYVDFNDYSSIYTESGDDRPGAGVGVGTLGRRSIQRAYSSERPLTLTQAHDAEDGGRRKLLMRLVQRSHHME